jgi:hypothetical protein
MTQAFDSSGPPTLMDFLAGYGRYKRRMGAETDPLLARTDHPIHGALQAALQQNTRAGSRRKGQYFVPVQVGHTLYHVYYSPGGKRTVIRVGGHATNQPDVIGTGL